MTPPSVKKRLLVYCDLLGDYFLFRNHLEHFRSLPQYQGDELVMLANSCNKPIITFLDPKIADRFVWINDLSLLGLTQNKLLKYPLTKHHGLKLLDSLGIPLEVDAVLGPTRAPWVTNLASWLPKAPYKIARALDDKGLNRIQSMINTELYRSGDPVEFLFDQHREFFEQATGASFQEVKLSFPKEKLLGLYPNKLPDSPYFVIFPDSMEAYKQWHPAYFAAVAIYLNTVYGWHLLVCGAAKNRFLGDEILNRLPKGTATNIMGQSTPLNVLDVIGQSELVVCNDSFALHASNAMGTPVICITQGLYSNHKDKGCYLPYPEKYRTAPHYYGFTPIQGGDINDLKPEALLDQLSGQLPASGFSSVTGQVSQQPFLDAIWKENREPGVKPLIPVNQIITPAQ